MIKVYKNLYNISIYLLDKIKKDSQISHSYYARNQCYLCYKKVRDEKDKPPYDYFMCSCYGPELDNLYDSICSYCADEQNKCKTCGIVYEDKQ